MGSANSTISATVIEYSALFTSNIYTRLTYEGQPFRSHALTG